MFASSITRRTFITGLTSAAILAPTVVQAQGRGKKYAVVVGVTDYDPEELNPLRFTQQDAEALAAELTRLQFDVTLMTNKASRPQLKPNSADKIARVLTNRASGLTNEDTLIFAFMGHGVQFAADKKDEVQEFYFCPEDARRSDRDTLLSMKTVYDTLGSSSAGRKLLLVDACRNDPQPKGKNRGPETELEPVGRTIRTVPQGMLALFSCSEGETSREYPDLDKGHGVFTYYVLKYLRGQADPTLYPRQELTVADMAHYVQRETKDFVWDKESKDQIPVPYGKLAPWSLGAAPSKQPAPTKQLAKTFRSQSSGMEFVLLPAGTFKMGSPASEVELSKDETQHSVTHSRPFYMGKYEVTQEEFERVMGFNPSHFTGSKRLPVEQVSWFDAVWFCNQLSERDGFQACYRLRSVEKDGESIKSAQVELVPGVRGYRLPTEAEWEYACRAGKETAFSFGANITPAQVNYDGNYPYGAAAKGEYREKTIEVDRLRENAFGLHQMHGNVMEWCQDWYGEYTVGSAKDPFGPTTGSNRVYRGGGWVDFALLCRSAIRFGYSPGIRVIYLGFRVALVPPAQ